ncbi:fatty acid synthase-like [Bemisia tabaci]|uniref:fatty acid synthase-like n=1 Tax=Bemisia tabaci TaxID=7038 RepID=UPI003B28491E
MQIKESLPHMVLLSSRTESGIEEIKRQIRNTKITPEFAALVNGVFSQEVQNHMYRCYAIVPPDSAKITIESERADGGQRPIWWVFSGMGSQWTAMGARLMHIPIFHDVINRCDEVLAPLGVDIKHVLTSTDEGIFDNVLNAFVGITACQIGLVEILRALKLEPAGMVGHSVGELGCAYADNCLTLKQAILAAHARGRASQESTLIKGMMAAVGMGHSDIINQLPESIDVACRNSSSSCTISGPAEDVQKFVSELSSKGVFARSVNVANIAYHSRYIQPAGPILLKYLKEAIPAKTKRSGKWISSSILEKDWDSDLATYCSPEYLTNNLLSPVLFEDAIKSIPSNAVLIEIGPHGLLQAILKRAMTKKATNVPLTHRSSEDGVKFLLEAIGQLYLLGFELDVSALYPPVQFPVPLDTPSLQPFVTWDHTEEYHLPKYMVTCPATEKCSM